MENVKFFLRIRVDIPRGIPEGIHKVRADGFLVGFPKGFLKPFQKKIEAITGGNST